MNFSKLSAISLSVALLFLAGCDIDKPYERISGIDPSKACPENFELDVDGMSATSISLFWDGKNAVSDGALSFTVQLTESPTAAGDNYSSLAKTVTSTDDAGNITEACSFSKLTKGERYFVRIRANYAYSVYSDWVYLKRDDIVVQVSVGNGLVISEFVEPQDFAAVAKTYSSIQASWSLTGPADGYQLEYAPAGSNEWIIVSENIVDAFYTITHLEQETSYDVRVKAFKYEEGGEKVFTDYSTVTGVQTPVKPDFSPSITTAEQLSRFFGEIAEQAGESDVYMLENDIDMSGYDILSAKSFVGTFDGKNHSILNWSNGGEPLFQVNSGTIRDLVIDASCQLSIIPGTLGFIASLNEGTIEGCVNNASASCNGDLTSVTYFGAIAGRSTGLVKNCVNNGDMIFDTSAGSSSNNCIGGVVGQFEKSAGVVAIENCTNNGAVKFSTGSTPKNMYIGGVVGGSVVNAKTAGNSNIGLKDYGIVKGCTNTGAVSHVWAVNASGSYCDVGGVAGYIEGAIEGCTNKGSVTLQDHTDPGASSTRPALGGVVGYVTKSAKDCVNEGTLNAKGVWAAGTEGNAGAGGIHQPLFGGVIGGAGEYYLASCDGFVSGCINRGTLNLEVCQKDAGGTQAGGGGVIAYSSVPVDNCHNEGELNIGLWHKVARVGGVIGWSYAATVSNCTNSGALTFDCNSAALGSNGSNFFSYQDYVGGVIGASLVAAQITNCENSGPVTYKGGVTQAVLNYIGGVLATYSGAQTMTGCKNSGKIVVDSAEALVAGSLCGAFNGVMTGCEATGDVEVKKCVGISGKEPEIGSLVGYANATFTDCTANNKVSVEAGGPSFYGGVCGGFGAASKQWSGCSVTTDLTTSGSVTSAKMLGRFRADSPGCTIYYQNMTFGGNISTLSPLGLSNNGSVVEGTME